MLDQDIANNNSWEMMFQDEQIKKQFVTSVRELKGRE